MLSNKTKNTVLFDLIHALRTTTHKRQVNSHIQKNILQCKSITESIQTQTEILKRKMFSVQKIQNIVLSIINAQSCIVCRG